MKYESELIKEIVETRGHEKSPIHYESECIEKWIEETKGAYPKLCDYQSEWLDYINKIEGGGTEQPNPNPPIGEFPYVVLSDVTEATIDNVVPYAYKSAILKGNTLVNLIQTIDKTTLEQYQDAVSLIHVKPSTRYLLKIKNNTSEAKSFYCSEITEWTQIDIEANQTITKTLTTKSTLGRNTLLQNLKTHTTEHDLSIIFIEYQDDMENWDIPYFEGMKSVQMPVLTTTGKNLFDINHFSKLENWDVKTSSASSYPSYEIKLEPNTTYTFSRKENSKASNIYLCISKNKGAYEINGGIIHPKSPNGTAKLRTITTDLTGILYFNLYQADNELPNVIPLLEEAQLEKGSSATPYEPYKSNILTVNEPVELRGIGKVKDELDLLTGKLTQRIDEDGSVLTQEVVKTVELLVQNQDGNTLSVIKPIEGKMHLSTSSDTIKPLFSGEIPVEAITQNLASFIDLEMEE